MTPPQETELRIPSVQPGVDIVGILHHKNQPQPQADRRIALILHGLLAHKNQAYHRALASALPIDSFRFDFRGNGETAGDWTMGDLSNELQDLSTVIRHLHHQLGYTIDLIVAHSRGSMVSWLYLSRPSAELKQDLGSKGYVGNYVSVSGRWDMKLVLQAYAKFQDDFDKQGYFTWNITSAGKKRAYIVKQKDLQALADFGAPTEPVARLNTKTNVLILHGTKDPVVHHRDTQSYFDALSSNPARSPDSHHVQLIEGADHNYRGFSQSVVDHILAWYTERGSTGPTAAARPPTSTSSKL